MTDTPRIISLITDFGLEDEYVGVMKGVIYTHCSNVQIVDISHAVAPQDIRQAARLLTAAYPFFPAHTVHLVVVDPGVGTQRQILLVETAGQFFIGPDNGVLTPVLQSDRLQCCRRLETEKRKTSATFHGRDIMAPAAAKLAADTPASELGSKIDPASCVLVESPAPLVEDDRIQGTVVGIDHYGNIATSIEKHHIALLGRDVEVRIGSHIIKGLYRTYGEAAPHTPVALINSRGEIEIAINMGSAQDSLNCRIGDRIIVEKGKRC